VWNVDIVLFIGFPLLLYVAENSCGKPVWFEVEEPVGSFTGRKEELENLHNMLTVKSQTTNATVINQASTISGLGGIGKSELARVYARDYRDYYKGNAIWIDAETDKSLLNSLVQLAKEHIRGYNDKVHRYPKAILELLFKHFSRIPCLLILDNVEGEDILKLLPRTLHPNDRKPTILITSRCTVWNHGVTVLPLGVLTETEAIAFIKKRLKEARVSDFSDIKQLVAELQYLPLALQQAAAYIKAVLKEFPNPIREYLHVFKSENEPKKLLQFKDGLRENEKTSLITWTVTMNRIKTFEFGKLAIRIMNLISYFEPDSIPIEIFFNMSTASSRWSPSRITELFNNSRSETIPQVRGAISLLKTYSMVSGGVSGGVISVHRLVQKVIRLRTGTAVVSILSEGITLIQNCIHTNPESDELIHSLLPHATSIWKKAEAYQKVTVKFNKFSELITQKQKYFDRPIWFNIKNPVDSFTSKEDLASLDLYLAPKTRNDFYSPIATVLCGPIGIGKRELVRKYVKHNEFYNNAIWLDGTNTEALKKCFIDLATTHLEIHEADAIEMSIADIFGRVYERRKKCLLILDSVSDLEVFSALPKQLKQADHISVLVLSTNPYSDWRNLHNIVNGFDLRW
jgi:hypothetical protein